MNVAGSSLLYSRLGLEAACDRLADLGFERIDLGVLEGWAHVEPSNVVGNVQGTADRVGDAIRAAGLDPIAFNVGLDAAGNAERRSRIRAVASLAEKLDVEVITLPAGPTDGSLDDDFERFRTLADAADGYDVALTVETHWGTHTEDPDVARRYSEEVSGLGVTLDPGHYAVGPHWPVDLDPLLPAVEHVHARQSGDAWEAVQRPLRAGRVDFDALLSTLRDADYDGAVSVEYIDALESVSPDEAEAQAAEMLAFLRKRA